MGVTRRPKFFQNAQQTKRDLEKSVQTNLAKYAVQAITELNNSVPMNQRLVIQQAMPTYLVIAERRAIKHGVIDMKPYFANSSSKKFSKGGGWYLVVPIRRKVSSMSHALYSEARAATIPEGASGTNLIAHHLYDNRPTAEVLSVNYQPVSNNLAKLRTGANRNMYVAYRTVGSKSPANSWIIGRGNVNSEDMSKSLMQNLDRLMKWKMKHM